MRSLRSIRLPAQPLQTRRCRSLSHSHSPHASHTPCVTAHLPHVSPDSYFGQSEKSFASTSVGASTSVPSPAGTVGRPRSHNGEGGGLDESSRAHVRLGLLTERLAEMERWFASVKGEASSERRMREQATQRLGLLQERMQRLQAELKQAQHENAQLKQRVGSLRAHT